jgi:hypothetical protein
MLTDVGLQVDMNMLTNHLVFKKLEKQVIIFLVENMEKKPNGYLKASLQLLKNRKLFLESIF